MAKRLLFASVVVCASVAVIPATQRLTAQGPDLGPGAGGAVLRMPGMPARPTPPAVQTPTAIPPRTAQSSQTPASGVIPPAPQEESAVLVTPGRPRPSAPGHSASSPAVLQLWNNHSALASNSPSVLPESPAGQLALQHLAPREGPDPNQDILITPEAGQWMLFVTSYTGPKSSEMARKMTLELRNKYKLKAYVFNYGEEERKKEYQRVKTLVDRQREFFRKNNINIDTPVRVRYMRIREQCGVLVGGYPSSEVARSALDDLQKLEPPDPKTGLRDKKYFFFENKDTKKIEKFREEYVNPFTNSFVAPNPTHKKQPADEKKNADEIYDVAMLRRMNSAEPYSLLKCRKEYTLAITGFRTPAVVQQETSKGFLEALGFGKSAVRDDAAAANAHNLAEALRKGGFEAYVLHSKFSSVVSIGGFDGLNDPSMRAMQNLLANQLKLDAIQLFKTPLPMKVPR